MQADVEEQRRAQVSQSSSKTVPAVQCIHRSWLAIGKINCSCANKPVVYACDSKFIISGYCLAEMPAKPDAGPIILNDGTKVVPADVRMVQFVPMPLRERERPRADDVVVCSCCPYRVDPPPHIARLKALGIVGDHDPETGHCEVLHVLHVLPNVIPKPERIPATAGRRECSVTIVRAANLIELVDATDCRLLIAYGAAGDIKLVKAVTERYPALKVWVVGMEPRIKREEIANVWYDLPDDLAAELKQHQDRALATAVARILE